MRNNKLGHTGLLVSELCLGTMTFGGGEGMWKQIGALNQADAEKLVGRSIDAGINFFDTADVYAEGLSEQITGQALRNLRVPRENVVVATKVFGQMGPGANGRGNSRVHLIDAIKASLAAWQIVKALGVSEREGLARFESLQAYYTLAGRDLEREIVPMLRHETVGLMVWSPLAGGLLSGKYSRDDEKSSEGRRQKFDFPPVDRARAYACIDAMKPMAEQRGVSVAQIALAWLLHQRVVSSVIIGAKRVDQLADNIAATDVELSDEELDTLGQVSVLPREYPGWMFETQGARGKVLAEIGRNNAR